MASSSRKKSLRRPLIGILLVFIGGLAWWGRQSEEPPIRTIAVEKKLHDGDWVKLDSILTVVAAIQDDGLRYKWVENGKTIFDLEVFLDATLTAGEVDTLRSFFGVMIQWQ